MSVVRSKFDHWCEGVIEAGWLAAVILAPMFFNVFSSRVFEPDKISLVRSIALIMIVAWLAKIVNGGPAWLPAFNASAQSSEEVPLSLWQKARRMPFFIPVILLIFAYLVSTALSVAPFVSWFGSYQRLQGTYSFLSYVTIAGLTAAHLRSPDQLRRLQHTIIITSFPCAVYGWIQHSQLDPLPWGGDVTTRVAANAGNAIFLGAYLIIAFFLTLERVYNSFAAIISADYEEVNQASDTANALAGAVYLVTLIVQVVAIFWTQSRGPWIGLFVGVYLFVLLLFSARRPKSYRLLTGIWAVLGISGAGLLLALNTVLVTSSICANPNVTRLCQILDTDGTGLVRILIWTGAADMMQPHEALEYPTGGSDSVNFLRQMVGYGPEAMWVAYNRFYPPALANVEARNASPDRSHNETWDSLVITGLLGFIGYMALFISIFYWALSWLGLIVNRRDKILFFSLLLIAAAVAIGLAVYLDNGSIRFFGVALPTGLMGGLVLYATLAAFLHVDYRPQPADIPRLLLIIAIFCAIIAHFAEIHFGIAIASTRTHFWVLTATMLVLGMRWAQPETVALAKLSTEETGEADASETVATPATQATGNSASAKNRKDRLRPTPPTRAPVPARRVTNGLSVLPSTIMTDILVFLTAVFIYTTNPQQLQDGASVFFGSVTSRMVGGVPVSSGALFFMLIFTWFFAATLGMTGEVLRQKRTPDLGWWLRGYGLHAAIVWFVWFVYGMIQGSRLTPFAQAQSVEQLNDVLNYVANHFAVFTWLVILWMAGTGTVFAWRWFSERRTLGTGRPAFVIIAAPVSAIFAFFLISSVNVDLVRADIIYKQGQQFDSSGQWVNSIELYSRALSERTTEDQYMLFLGRSLLEQAKTVQVLEGTARFATGSSIDQVLSLRPSDVVQMGRLDLLRAAESVLIHAQSVNPLNTDHTANLARLYRTWADLTVEQPEMRAEMLDKSLAMYDVANKLSPNAAHLWNEKGNAFQAKGQNDQALETYLLSAEIDPLFEQTYLLLGDFYERNGQYEPLIALMKKGIDTLTTGGKGGYTPQLWSYLGVAYARTNNITDSIAANVKVLEMQPGNAAALRNLVLLYQQQGDLPNAALAADQAIAAVGGPAAGQVFTDMVTMGAQVYQQIATQEPTNYQPLFKLALLFQQLGQIDTARQFAQQALQLAPEADKPAVQELAQMLGG